MLLGQFIPKALILLLYGQRFWFYLCSDLQCRLILAMWTDISGSNDRDTANAHFLL